jgi:hypothetical protein
LFDPIRGARQEKSGKQLGDPAKAAEVLLKIANAPDAPVHLLLGSDAVTLVKNKIAAMSDEMKSWESVSTSTDHQGM